MIALRCLAVFRFVLGYVCVCVFVVFVVSWLSVLFFLVAVVCSWHLSSFTVCVCVCVCMCASFILSVCLFVRSFSFSLLRVIGMC